MWSAFLLFMVFMAPGWWILTGLYVIWAFILSDKDCWEWVIGSMFIYFVYIVLLSGLNVFQYATEKPLHITIFIVAHFILGFIWSFPRWWLYVREKAERAREDKEKYMKEKMPKKPEIKTEHDENVIKAHEKECKAIEDNWYRANFGNKKPIVKENVNRIVSWIIYWEFSFIRSLLRDIVHRMWRQIVLRFSKVYQKMSDKAFVGLEKVESKD